MMRFQPVKQLRNIEVDQETGRAIGHPQIREYLRFMDGH
jgi:hypothetical protein